MAGERALSAVPSTPVVSATPCPASPAGPTSIGLPQRLSWPLREPLAHPAFPANPSAGPALCPTRLLAPPLREPLHRPGARCPRCTTLAPPRLLRLVLSLLLAPAPSSQLTLPPVHPSSCWGPQVPPTHPSLSIWAEQIVQRLAAGRERALLPRAPCPVGESLREGAYRARG